MCIRDSNKRKKRNSRRNKRSAPSKTSGATSKQPKPDPCKLYISYVPEEIPNDTIANVLRTFGPVKNVERPTYLDNMPQHYVFVTMASVEDASAAVAHDGPVYIGGTKVALVKSQKSATPTPAWWNKTVYIKDEKPSTDA